MSNLASSFPSPCLSFPACEGLGLLPALRSLHIPIGLPWAALGLSPKLPPRISGLMDPESHLGSPRTEAPPRFLHGWLGTAAHASLHGGLPHSWLMASFSSLAFRLPGPHPAALKGRPQPDQPESAR